MKYKFFAMPARHPEVDEAELQHVQIQLITKIAAAGSAGFQQKIAAILFVNYSTDPCHAQT